MERLFIKQNIAYPTLIAILSGLYPVLFYYSNNYHIVNSWEHVRYFTLVFLTIPIVVFVFISLLFSTKKNLKQKKYVLPFLSAFTLLYLLKICVFIQVERKIIVGIIILSIAFSYFLNRYFKQWLQFLVLLNIIGFIALSNTIYKRLNYSKEWMQQPDEIVSVLFKKKPNVYFIQPDGYANPSQLKSDYYQFDNSDFESFLSQQNFIFYPDFRSNYSTTLSSNGAIFTMKHHYYNLDSQSNEVQFARKIIISDNDVLSVFKNNGYKTYYLAESPYLLLNRPLMGYDYCNINYQDFKFLNEGIGKTWEIKEPLKQVVYEKTKQPKFVFLELLKPWHIESRKNTSTGAETERKKYLERLQESNQILKQLITEILTNDSQALILIMADHGGYVGMDYTDLSSTKTEDPKLINSIFTSILAIHWGEKTKPDYTFTSSVNIFRTLFSYLSENNNYLKHLEEDASYIILKSNIKKGIYKYIDSQGNPVLEKIK